MIKAIIKVFVLDEIEQLDQESAVILEKIRGLL
jgi:hypothetical protein